MAKKKNRGWIKLYRQITDSSIWKSSDAFDRRSAWIDLLLMVNHEERVIQLRNGHFITVKEGQCFTSMDHLADRWHWSRNKVKRYLAQLSGQGMCTLHGTPSGTLLTIEKYSFFQGGRPTDEPTDEPTGEPSGGLSDEPRTRTNNKNYINKNDKQEKAGTPPEDSFFSSEEY